MPKPEIRFERINSARKGSPQRFRCSVFEGGVLVASVEGDKRDEALAARALEAFHAGKASPPSPPPAAAGSASEGVAE